MIGVHKQSKQSCLFCFVSAVLIVFGCLPVPVTGQNYLLSYVLPSDYDSDVIPLQPQDNGTFYINVSISLNQFTINEMTQVISADLTLCFNWTDYRILPVTVPANTFLGQTDARSYDQIRMTSNLNAFWRPFVYLRNGVSTNIVTTLIPIQFIQIWPNQQTLRFCTRMVSGFVCRMDIQNFPFEQNYCYFEMETYVRKDLNQTVRLQIEEMRSTKGNNKFRIKNYWSGRCGEIRMDNFALTAHNDARYECTHMVIRLVRSINYYVIRYYCPTFLMVICSFVCFWIPTNGWPARVMLCVLTLMTLMTVSLTAYNEVPSTGVVSLYWWLWFCQFFVYMALIEFAFALSWVNFINAKKRFKAGSKTADVDYYFGSKNVYGWFGKVNAFIIKGFFGPHDHYRDPVNRNKVDYCSRLLYPFLLLIFVVVYICATVPLWSTKYRW